MRKILILIIMISMFGCKTTNKVNSSVKNANIEKFNLKGLKNQELTLNQLYKEEVKNSIIEYGVFGDIIVKNVWIKGNPYYTKKTYHKSNYQLKAKSTYFYQVPIGISKKYDEKGHVIEEINWALLEKRDFSVEDLIKKMKKDFKIDLMNSEENGVVIGGDPLAYRISVFPNRSTSIRLIQIDARTGQLLSDETSAYKK